MKADKQGISGMVKAALWCNRAPCGGCGQCEACRDFQQNLRHLSEYDLARKLRELYPDEPHINGLCVR